jgi:hypothetical protein
MVLYFVRFVSLSACLRIISGTFRSFVKAFKSRAAIRGKSCEEISGGVLGFFTSS